MREAYHEQLNLLIDDLVRMALMVEDSMTLATNALLDADAKAAQRVSRGEPEIAAIADDIDERALILVARQQPMAGDLRILVAALRSTSDLERMSRLAGHVAQVVLQRHPDAAVPPQLKDTVASMGRVARRITAEVIAAMMTRDWHAAARLDRDDDAMDKLQETLYRQVLDGAWPHGAKVAIDAALIGRYFERYADHAVAVAHHVAFLAGHEPLDRLAATDNNAVKFGPVVR